MTKNLLTLFLAIAILLVTNSSFTQDDASQEENARAQAAARLEAARAQAEARLLDVIEELKEKLADEATNKDDHHLIHKEIARAYIRMGKYDDAIIHMKKSINLQETAPVQEFQAIGSLMFQGGRIDESLPLLLKGSKLYPDSVDIAMMLATALTAKDDYKAAVAQYEKVEKLTSKQTTQSLSDTFYFRYGAAVERIGEIEKAAQLFQKCLELIPPGREEDEFRATVLNYLGYMWIENDMKINIGGELIKKAAKLQPDSGAIADSLGWYHFKKKDYFNAMNELIRAEALMTEEDSVVYDHIAQTFFQLGNQEDAVKYMKKAIKLDPENKEFKDRLSQFSK